jgi:subtilase family serine protease
MRVLRSITVAAAACGLAATALTSAIPTTAAVRPTATVRQTAVRQTAALADVAVRPGVMHVGRTQASPLTTADCEKLYKVACYGPQQIQQAYDLPALYAKKVTGRGATIVIVDSFGSPTITNDLKVFDSTYKLPAPPSFKIIKPVGDIPPYNPGNSDMVGWASETTLDVEYAHTIAPGANILLVETPVSETEGVHGFPQIVAAEQYVLAHHLGDVISQSFSATERTFPDPASIQALRAAYLQAERDKVTVLAASGDSGAADVGRDETTYYLSPVTSWPDSDPLVTGVGGTQLRFNRNGTPAVPVVWNDTYNTAANEFADANAGPNPLASGGGLSQFFARPSYQDGVKGVVGAARGVPDISMSAACNGSVNTYGTFGGTAPGWTPTCGTSEATPLFAGIVALADQVAGHSLGLLNPALYRLAAAHAPGLVDVTSGNNTVSFTQAGRKHTVPGYPARRGYDLASGVGTVDARYFVPELAALLRH